MDGMRSPALYAAGLSVWQEMLSVQHFSVPGASINLDRHFLLQGAMKTCKQLLCIIISAGISLSCTPASAWYDKTHLAIAQATGYERWYNAVGADIAKLKAGRKEYYNHYFNNDENREVTADLVLSQVRRYNNPKDAEGHLYGAIIGALRGYAKSTREFKYAEHHIAYCIHYVGDLSQPLHNVPHDAFNRMHHNKNDGIVDEEIMANLARIKENMYPITFRPERFEEDLAREIARIANISRHLGLRLKRENRDMTRAEAYRQLGHSASLLQAILKHYGKVN